MSDGLKDMLGKAFDDAVRESVRKTAEASMKSTFGPLRTTVKRLKIADGAIEIGSTKFKLADVLYAVEVLVEDAISKAAESEAASAIVKKLTTFI